MELGQRGKVAVITRAAVGELSADTNRAIGMPADVTDEAALNSLVRVDANIGWRIPAFELPAHPNLERT